LVFSKEYNENPVLFEIEFCWPEITKGIKSDTA